MKKRICFIGMAFVMIFSTASCMGADDRAERFIDAVLEIGAVDGSDECRDRILNAVSLFNKLPQGDWLRVEPFVQILEQSAAAFYKLTGELLFTRPEAPDPDLEPEPGKKPNENPNPGNQPGETDKPPVVVTPPATGGGYDPDKDPSACTFYDDFSPVPAEYNLDGTGLDKRNWFYENSNGGGFGNGEAQAYRPENIEVVNGKLRLVAKKESYKSRSYTSAKIMTGGRPNWYREDGNDIPKGEAPFAQTYGRFEAKLRLSDAIPGFWPAFWMMPQDSVYGGWPRSGEIDIMEMKGRLRYNASCTLHSGEGGGSWYAGADINPRNNPDLGFDITDFHIYTCEWEPGLFRFYIDHKFLYSRTWDGVTKSAPAPASTFGGVHTWRAGSRTATAEDPVPFNRDFYMIINFAINGAFDSGRVPDSAFTSSNPALASDPYLEMDYVAAYSLKYMKANPLESM